MRSAVLSTLRYYDLFHYPLTVTELHGSMPYKCTIGELEHELQDIVNSGQAFSLDGYYSLSQDLKDLTSKRLDNNRRAAECLPKAIRCGHFISHFPFVRFVGISGSLSKGVADPSSDFDFFVVTETHRMWIARTIMHFYKKFTFLVGRQHRYCMNYFIDTHNLELEEKNRYTAIELASLIPLTGSDVYTRIINDNDWVHEQLPNGYVHFVKSQPPIEDKGGAIKNGAERILNLLAPNAVNKLLMTLTDKKWRRKWARRNYPMHEYDTAFKTTLHVSKNHEANHQKRVMEVLHKSNYANV